MKKKLIAIIVLIAAFVGGYFISHVNSCPCGVKCACTACNCTK